MPPSLNFPQVYFVKPSSGFHPVTWERVTQVGVSGRWMVIAPRPKLGLGRVLNQSCSSRRDLSNAVLHSLRRRREEVDSRLLVVGSQTDSLTLGPSFAHNLGYKCPNGQCKAISGIYASRPFQWYEERTKAKRFDPSNHLLNFWRTPFPTFGSVSCIFTLRPKVGLQHVVHTTIASMKRNWMPFSIRC